MVRVRDVARIELGAQNYNVAGRLNGKPAAIIAVYQLPGSNALDTVARRAGADGGAEAALPDGPRLRRLARHDAGGHRGHQRDRRTRSSRRSCS